MASQDQVNFSLEATSDFWREVLGNAQAQGRVYFLFTKIIDLWLAARPEGWRIHAFNVLIFALSGPCFAYALFRSSAQRLLYCWLFASAAWASYHHMPPAAYPSVNHLPFLLWALAAFLVRRGSARGGLQAWRVVSFGVLAFVSLFQYEPVAAMSLCVLGWLAHAEPLPDARKRLALALGSAALLYAACYAGWRLKYPTSYDGAMVGELSLWNVLRVAIAYGVGGLPFCQAFHDAPRLRFGDQRVGETLLSLSPPAASSGTIALLLTASALLGLHWCYATASRPAVPERRVRIGLWVMPVILLFAINGPLGLSEKYQQWVRDLDETYLTSQLALYPFLLLGTLLLGAAYRYARVRGVPVAFALLTLAVAMLSLPVHAHNQSITSIQRANLARWEAAAAIAAYADHIDQAEIVAPDLYYSVFIGERNWTEYWGRYIRYRFGGWLSFLARAPEGRGDYARVRMFRFEDGRLRALTIQTPGYTAIVARPANAPLALVFGSGVAVPLDWSEAETLERSGYSAVTLSEPADSRGPEQWLEPVWVWPQTPLALSH
jgi:hypothetical protein